VLGECLSGPNDIPAALRRYEDRRGARTARVAQQSLRAGKIAQAENPLTTGARDALLKAVPKRVLVRAQLRQMEGIAGYEA
jgi:2-polyprenyl-6-methoxyphenol hydroxylase-like FAD-dependent oxidoreductase